MGRFRFGMALGGAALALLAQAAAAQPAPHTLEPTGEWSVERKTDRCVLSRNFGSGDGASTLVLERGAGHKGVNLIMTSPLADSPFSGFIKLQFGPHEATTYRLAVREQIDETTHRLIVHDAQFAPEIETAPRRFKPDTFNEARLARIETLSLRLIGKPPLNFSIGSAAAPMALLDQCSTELMAEFKVQHDQSQSHPKPADDHSEWLRPEDYPRDLFFRGEEANMAFTLVVDETGTANFCEFVPNERTKQISDALCRKILKRARFTPAINQSGDPAPGWWGTNIRFKMKK